MLLSGLASVNALGNKDEGLAEPAEKAVVAEKKAESSDYPPQGWVTDIKEAYKIAQADNKQILVNFTGSDWCVWCKKLSKEVFTTPEFKAYADKNLVLLYLDFPQSLKLPQEQVNHNQIIAQLLNVRGYPSIWLLDSDYSPLMVTGYREGGAEEYIRHLSEDRPEVSDKERENFRASFTEAVEVNFGALE
jgi:protein disulfide-isomerase